MHKSEGVKYSEFDLEDGREEKEPAEDAGFRQLGCPYRNNWRQLPIRISID
jgi:hypothetical protein